MTDPVLALLKLHAATDAPLPTLINRTAWDLRENGWGSVAGRPDYIANLVHGLQWQVKVFRDGGVSLFPIADFNLSEFVDPTEPVDEPVVPDDNLLPFKLPPPDSTPPVAFDPLTHGAEEFDPGPVPPGPAETLPLPLPGLPPMIPLSLLQEIDYKLQAIMGNIEIVGRILDDFQARIETVENSTYTGSVLLPMGLTVKFQLTRTPVQPDNPVVDGEPQPQSDHKL